MALALADRAQRPAGRPRVGLAAGGAAGHPGLRPQLCLGQPRARPCTGCWPACWSPRCPISRSSISRWPRRCAGSIRPSRSPRPRSGLGPVARVLARRAAAAAAGHLRRRAAGRPAPAGRIRPVRDDPLRHLHHRDRRPVPVHLQRPGGQHAGRRAGALLPRPAAGRGPDAAATSAMPASAPGARPARRACRLGGYSSRPCSSWPRSTALALGVPLRHVVRWLVAGGAAVWRRTSSADALLPDPGPRPRRRAGRPPSLAFPMAWLVDPRARAGAAGSSKAANYIASSLPGIVVALALVTITVRVALPLYQTAGVADRRLRADVPAARAGQPAGRHRAGARGARRGRAGAGQPPLVAVPRGSRCAWPPRPRPPARRWCSSASSTS